MRVGSLFAGIGGFDLAARWVGWQTAWFSEINPYASAVLQKHWPGVPNHGDITLMKGSALEPVDVLCGGFPCQDISLAGKGAGLEGERSGLWFQYARLIEELRPRWVVAENVSALRSRGLAQVLGSLAALGYDAEWHCIPAAAVGAPHRRDRVWIVAHPTELQLRQVAPAGAHDARHSGARSVQGPTPILAYPTEQSEREPATLFDAVAAGGEARNQPGRGRSSVADAPRDGRKQRRAESKQSRKTGRATRSGSHGGWWATEPDVGRVAHGVSKRVDRLSCLGNAIVPHVAFLVFQAIQAVDNEAGVSHAA